ncbi:MAG: lytic transglycosylase domain-containing protein [Candidatus Adiutrix sp.]|jgi:soluble lytic murein transglycosylase-like protein|nr:lytic transglycosylase domain-containing protein [Candidatus Adiutrix sp.]
MDIGNISQMLRDSKIQGNLRNHPLAGRLGLSGRPDTSGFMMSAADAPSIPPLGQGGGMDEFSNLVALAQAQVEMSVASSPDNAESARSLAQIKAMSVNNDMLQGLVGMDQGGGSEDPAMELIRQMNAEAILSADNFGNLRGSGAPGFDSGRTFSPAEMSSLRQKNGFLREAPPKSAEAEAGQGEEKITASQPGGSNLMMPYGRIRAPHRPPADRGHSLKTAEAKAPVVEETQKTAAAQPPASAEAPVAPAATAEVAPDNDKHFTREDLDKLVGRVAKALSLDPALVMAVIKTESNFDHEAVSRVGAKGLMQLMPGTAKDLGVEDPFNPVENVWGGARYLKQMLDRHNGSVDKALASYNWGPGNFDRYRRKGGQMPTETRNYIARVNQHYSRFKQDLA